MKPEFNILGNSDYSKPQDIILQEVVPELSYKEQEQHRQPTT